ncbi:oligosaccharide flippase family protein [Oribacterium sp. oral taxon 102]|uniref:oligosaccharide flippase family protein n=1 Tax=Oribacterium sp. oral taxon 102 TaxID=671214 RepID=UPI0015BE4C01|nr:oligosaccharide flippase family protein [Oribacterium sp. oral taxon 102]NWO22194.1 oligosaccharide flippase family protein [Oribacterium sp. oral taxon 102]
MENKLKYLIKNLGLLTISNFASKILVFLLVPLYTNILTTEEYGTYDLVVTTVSFVFPILTLNICDAVMRFSLDKNYDVSKVASIGLKFIIINLALSIVGVFIAAKICGEIIEKLCWIICLYYIAYSIYQYLNQLAQGNEKVFDIGIAGLIGTVSVILCNVFFLIVVKAGLEGFFYANTLALLVPAIYLAFRLDIARLVSFGSSGKIQKEMLIYSMPLIASVVGWLVNNTSDKYVVAGMCGVAASGILSVSYKIPQIIGTLQNIFLQAWQISAIKEYDKADSAAFYGKAFSFVNVLMCLACSALIVLLKPLALILYAKDFFIAWQYVPFLLLGCVFNNASGMLGSILAAQKNTKILSLSTMVGAVLNLILNVGLIYILGVQGATIATAASSYVIYIIRKSKISHGVIGDEKNLVLIWGLLVLQCTVEIFDINVLIQIPIILLIIWLNKNGIISVFSAVFKLIKTEKNKAT